MELEAIRLIDALPGLVWTALPDGQIDFLNQRWCQHTGLSPREASGWGWQSAIFPADRPQFLDQWRSIVASGKPGEMEVLTDIEDRKRAEDALRASERSLQQIINTIPTTAWSTRPDGFDATDDRVHGNQEGRHFHGYCGSWCFLPLYVFCGEQLFATILSRLSSA